MTENFGEYSLEYNNHEVIIREKKSKYNLDLRKRLLEFAVESIIFIRTIPYKKEYDVFRYQFSKSCTSIGANYEESQSSSFREFIQRIRISLREANESKYWLRIMDRLDIGDTEKRKHLLREAEEIALILGSIVSKLYRKMQ